MPLSKPYQRRTARKQPLANKIIPLPASKVKEKLK